MRLTVHDAIHLAQDRDAGRRSIAKLPLRAQEHRRGTISLSLNTQEPFNSYYMEHRDTGYYLPVFWQ